MTMETTQTATTWLARIHITLKTTVVDPQGNTILDALHQLHFDTVQRVRMGKYLEVTLEADDEAAARERVVAMCATLLANPVIEHYDFTLSAIQ